MLGRRQLYAQVAMATEHSQDMLLEKIQKYVSLFSLPMWKVGQEGKYLELWNDIKGIIFVCFYSKDMGIFLNIKIHKDSVCLFYFLTPQL